MRIVITKMQSAITLSKVWIAILARYQALYVLLWYSSPRYNEFI